ncbi:hypothetical protein [Ruminiclostridium papyrosolvens]|uniref:Uncharacterized protein n=1 Tax=Ruminiclostridium papyrosolvens C7 TaxID=1330534 RepID=U4R2D5_9FIRM|nr:hypothetical protein [Ruminiclostridium papyrosolvens]EPR12509.1 hypothetical protein L323_08130 [Ruminiclostridium papyrosolvens C7]
MAFYLAKRIEASSLDYYTIFSSNFFKPYKADVDAMLIADGRQDLIVDIP